MCLFPIQLSLVCVTLRFAPAYDGVLFVQGRIQDFAKGDDFCKGGWLFIVWSPKFVSWELASYIFLIWLLKMGDDKPPVPPPPPPWIRPCRSYKTSICRIAFWDRLGGRLQSSFIFRVVNMYHVYGVMYEHFTRPARVLSVIQFFSEYFVC